MIAFLKSYLSLIAVLSLLFCLVFVLEHVHPFILPSVRFTHFYTTFDFLYFLLVIPLVIYPFLHTRLFFSLGDVLSLSFLILVFGVPFLVPCIVNLLSRFY
jgi:hypothetical protein